MPENPYHEEGDVNPKAIMLAGVGLLAALVVTGFVVAGTRAWFGGEHPNEKISSKFEQVEREPMAEPGVELQPSKVLERVRAQNQARLTNYMWLDEQRQRAQIPIDRAIELVAERGLPHRESRSEEESP